jgi:hypothetical protein
MLRRVKCNCGLTHLTSGPGTLFRFLRTSKILEVSIWKLKGPAVNRAYLSIISAAGFLNELGRYAGWRLRMLLGDIRMFLALV